MIMLKSYLTIAIRNSIRNKRYFTLNVLGLALGISCFVTLGLFVQSELSYDTFLKDADQIYRITTYFKRGDQEVKWAITNGGLVPLLIEKVSGIEDATLCYVVQSNNTFIIGDNSFVIPERTGFFVEENFLSIFNFNVLAGVDSTMLKEFNGIVLTEKFALKLFGRTDVLGESIDLKGQAETTPLIVTGVLNNIPVNSHIQFDYLFTGNISPQWNIIKDPKNGGFPVHVYFKTLPGTIDSVLAKTIAEVTRPVYGEMLQFPIQPVTEIHFNANNLFEHARKGNVTFIRVLSIVAVFILSIAIVNYIILSTAQSLKRTKEIGVRKTIGSTPIKLVMQFLIESSLIGLSAGITSILISEMLLKSFFPSWFDVHLSIFDQSFVYLWILGFAWLVGLLAGLFPATQASRLNAVGILRGQEITTRTDRLGLRSLLVTLQFIFTIAIITGSIVVTRQLFFLKNKNIGYTREFVINIPRPANASLSSWNHFRELLENEAVVASVGSTLYKFISDYNATGIQVIDEINADTLSLRVQWNAIDANLIPTLDMHVVEGRNFSPDIAGDSLGILVNEAAARQLGLHSLSEKKVLCFFFGGTPGKILGVVRDFHFQSFYKEIIPIVFIPQSKNFAGGRNLLVKVQSSDLMTTLQTLERQWKESGFEAPFDYAFLDDWFKSMIQREHQLSNMVLTFAALSISISVLGLIGLVSFTTALKRKEIGVRRVFGASVKQILLGINAYFLKFMLAAFILAVPISWWGIEKWLENFAYRVTINVSDYLWTAAIFFVTVMLAIIVQSWRAAHTNPIEALKEG
jgi:putative ABC transport system permease protein